MFYFDSLEDDLGVSPFFLTLYLGCYAGVLLHLSLSRRRLPPVAVTREPAERIVVLARLSDMSARAETAPPDSVH